MLRYITTKNTPVRIFATRRALSTTLPAFQAGQSGERKPDSKPTQPTPLDTIEDLEANYTSIPLEAVSGAPADLSSSRIVRIYREAKAATQSGTDNTKFWRMDWDVLGKGNRWENDMMGYQGSSDYMQGTIMKFDTKEGAVRFAEGHGWNYYIQEPKVRKFRKKEYSLNFLHSSGPLKHIRTK